MSRSRIIELLLFATCFVAFAYFNQGGGWNQNARFAEVRAIAEEGRFAIDDYLVYMRQPGGDDLERLPTERAAYRYHGELRRLCWVDGEWNLSPIDDAPLGAAKKAPMIEDCSSGDVAYVQATGHFHANKPPGTSFLAVPSYFLLYHLEKWLGINTDGWWALGVNAWLASVFSVGLISAFGCVLFYRLACDVSGGATRPAALATFAFAFGTTFFPFSTLLFDHDLTASFLVAAFYFLRRAHAGGWVNPFLAGLCAGMAVLTNLVSAVAIVLLGVYAVLARAGGANLGDWRMLAIPRTVFYILGGLPPALALAAFNYHNFGGVLNLATNYQSPLFKNEDAFLGMFLIPHTVDQFWYWFYAIKVLTYTPFRGVFWFCPVLLAGLAGLAVWLRRGWWADALTCLGIFGAFFLVNTLFNGYHAGFSAGPRYLIPGLPFLALPLVTAFQSWRVPTALLGVISIAVNLLLTITDAQNPAGVGGHARVEKTRMDSAKYNLISEYAWPLFWEGSCQSLLAEQLEQQLEANREQLAAEDLDPAERATRLEERRVELQQAITQGAPAPFILASIRGPVSVNPIGVYEGLLEYRLFPAGSTPCRWASFNVGEFLWPASRWSILPLLLLSGGGMAWTIWLAGLGRPKSAG